MSRLCCCIIAVGITLSYAIGSQNKCDITCDNGSSILNVQNIQGRPGKAGPPGRKGEKGDVGNLGLRGRAGLQGIKGESGTKGSKGNAGQCSCSDMDTATERPEECSAQINFVSGPAEIYLKSHTPTKVYCEVTTDSIWTVIQRRNFGNVDFYRSFWDYFTGFGDASGDFWVGLDAISKLTSDEQTYLKIELEYFNGTKGYALYSSFKVASGDGWPKSKFTLTVGGFTGNAGDVFNGHKQIDFSTFDADYDQQPYIHCAKLHRGGWWFTDCSTANPNGFYNIKPNQQLPELITNSMWSGLKSSKMMVAKKSKLTHLMFNQNCVFPSHLDNGRIVTFTKVSSPRTSLFSFDVRYFCDEGYELMGSANSTCRADGTWSSAPPKCVPIDYGICGQAGPINLNEIKNTRTPPALVSDEQFGVWPWHAVVSIMYSSNDVLQLYLSRRLKGGGSIVNQKWILTAASLFDFGNHFAVTVGLHQLPTADNPYLPPTARIYKSEKVFKHPKFDAITFKYDYALIKIGKPIIISKDGLKFTVNESYSGETSLKFSPHIRPVCLPCSPHSCVNKMLRKPNGNGDVLIKGTETKQEMCEIEKKYLMFGSGDKKLGAVVTGFGYEAPASPTEELIFQSEFLSRNLKQIFLQILSPASCKRGMKIISNRERAAEGSWVYDDNVICTQGFDTTYPVDTCYGDGGGPLVKEVKNEEDGTSCWVQIGIVSSGYGCAFSDRNPVTGVVTIYPSINSNVLQNIDWILNNSKV